MGWPGLLIVREPYGAVSHVSTGIVGFEGIVKSPIIGFVIVSPSRRSGWIPRGGQNLLNSAEIVTAPCASR